MAPSWLLDQDWMTFDLLTAGPEMELRLADTFGAFFATKRKAELFDWALSRGAMLAPVHTLADLLDDIHLAARQAWRTVELGVEGDPFRIPGPPIRLGVGAWEPRGGPPAVGQRISDVEHVEAGG